MHTQVTARSVIFDPDGRMLILRRSQTDPRFPGTWDLPGGRAEPGETVEQTAVRETAEETGIELKDPELLFATSDVRSGVGKTWVFFAGNVSANTEVTLSFEHDDYMWILPANLTEYTEYEVLLGLHRQLMRLQSATDSNIDATD